MGTLGEKSYNYNFYGLPDPNRVWGTAGVGGYASLIHKNLYMQVFDDNYEHAIYSGDPTKSPAYGKPLDDTIALWYIPNSSSFACNCIFSVDRSSSLNARYTINQDRKNAVPVTMGAIDASDGAYGKFSRNLEGRYAYDTSDVLNGPYSTLIYDIVYNNFCLRSSCTYFNIATKARANVPIDSIHTTFTDENFKAVFIQSQLYRAATIPRFTGNDYIPPLDAMTTAMGQPLVDTLTDISIPENETYLKSTIQRGHSEWRDDAIYRPFYTQIQQMLYNSTGTSTSTNQHNIGFDRQLTVSQIKNGAYLISDDNRISAQYYRCNYDRKDFPDVSYRWRNVAFDETNLIELNNGFNLDLLSNSSTIRFMTVLDILDRKGTSYGQAVENAVKHEIAFIGLYFVSSVSNAQNAELGTGSGEGIYLPERVKGVTTGNYFTGEDIRSVPYANSQSVSDPDFRYDPSSSEEDSGEFKSIIHSGRVEAGTRYYAMTQAQADSIITYLNTTYQPDTIEQLTVDFKGSNPFDYFTIFKYYPFDIPILSGAGAEVNIGPLDLGWKAPVLEYGYGIPGINYLNMGSVYLDAKYRDFRDYQDTSIIVMLPWCGLVSLDPKIWLEHTLTVRYAIDFVTGTVTAYLLKDDLIWDSANGKLGVDIPLSALANGTYQNEITNALYQLKQAENSRMWAGLGLAGGLIGTAISAATGNLVGAAGGIGAAIASVNKLNQIGEQIDNLEYRIDHTQPRMGVISSASPLNSCVEDQRVKVYMIRHMMLSGYDAAAYGKTIGFSCAKSGKLGSFKGFTKCAAIDLSGVPCSEAEKNMIKNICTKGVRV